MVPGLPLIQTHSDSFASGCGKDSAAVPLPTHRPDPWMFTFGVQKNWKPSMAHIAQERGHGAAESLTCSRHSGQQASRIPDCLQACTILHHLDRVLLGSLVSKTKGKTRKPKVSKATRSIMTESNKSGRNRWKETNQIEHYDSTSCTFHF